MTRVQAERADITQVAAEVVCLGIFKGVRQPGGAARAVDRALQGEISALLRDGDFPGNKGETYLLRTEGKLPAKRVLLVGLGSAEEFSLETVREVSAAAALACQRYSELTTIVHGAGIGGLEAAPAAQALVEGTLLGLYQFRRFKSEGPQPEGRRLQVLRLIEANRDKFPQVETGAERGRIVAEAACLARDLANEPGASLTPQELARRAQERARQVGLHCNIFDEQELARQNMGGILAVGRGSEEPPRLIVLEHRPGNVDLSKPPVVLVGKGITFDSGGLSLKPRESLESMKYDMGGAAAVLGALDAIARLQVPRQVIGLIAAAENMPSGRALKPGDVIRISNGVTVEVTNTDAEGRLVLADALVYAKRYSPAAVIDLATLTGACVTALGKEAAGLFSNDERLLQQIQRAAAQCAERVWPLPLYEEYGEILKSEVADIKNSNLKVAQAGACVGATFLRKFVDYPWAHLDIAGVAYDVETRKYWGKGATGFGVRLLTELLQQIS